MKSTQWSGESQSSDQALLDTRLASAGWDASQFLLDPVWQIHFICERNARIHDPIRMMHGSVQARTWQSVMDVLERAGLWADSLSFDCEETERRLRSEGLPEEQVQAALSFTLLTNASVFGGYGEAWRALEQSYERQHEQLLKRHRLLLVLASMRDLMRSASGTHDHKNGIPDQSPGSSDALDAFLAPADRDPRQSPEANVTTGGTQHETR
jgi:hypothetical protein